MPKDMKLAPRISTMKISFHIQFWVDATTRMYATVPRLTANNK